METLTIGAVARRTGISAEAIRYYEKRGVLETAARDRSGYRRFDERVIDELFVLKAAQKVGFSLDEIARLLALTRKNPIPCRSMCELAEERIASIDDRIEELAAARDRLASAVDACGPDDVCAVTDELRSGVDI